MKAEREPLKASAKPRAVAPKQKPANMSQEAWDEEQRRCDFATADRRRRRIAAQEYRKSTAKEAAEADVFLSLGGRKDEGTQRRCSPSSPGWKRRRWKLTPPP
jgi:hypothetical protein